MPADLGEDPVLRDVPVVQLSRDERSNVEAVLSRVRGALLNRAALERRLRAVEASATGSMADVTPHRLLRMVSGLRPDARLTVRDGSRVHEVRLRHGVPTTATSVSAEGAVTQGAEALQTLLQTRVGDFVVELERGSLEAQLQGTLASQLDAHVARMRSPERTEPMYPGHPEPAQRTLPLPLPVPVAPPRYSWQPETPPSPPARRWVMTAAVVAVGIAGIALGVLLRVLQSV